MTLEQLKAAAKAEGYRLVKIKNVEPLLPCTCGCNRREHWFGIGFNKYGLRCERCGIHVWGSSEEGVRKTWNELMQR